MDFLTLAKERYSVRKFSDKKVEEEKLEKILEAGIVAPTAVNFQPFKIWVVQSPEALEKTRQATRCHFDAPVILVLGAKTSEGWVRKYDNKNFAEVDASIVGTHMMLEVQDLGLGSTWVGVFDQAKMKEFFPEMNGYELIALFPIGYPAEDAAPAEMHTKFRPKEELVKTL